jgi:peptidoglycan/LPS O-acetylase OafA/YrhL
MSHLPQRMPLIDALKAVASQLIVLHHLAFYGPMSDVAYPIAPGGIDWLYEYGRMSVQVFLVIAGYLAARSLAPDANPRPINPIQAIWSRYRRLAPPLLLAILTSVACAAIARQWICHPSIPEAPNVAQIITHALLLQNVLGQDALSAGVWYVAIDFQLFAMFVGILWLAGMQTNTRARTLVELIICLGCASLFYFNMKNNWDNWGLYFFGSYALGIAAQWCAQKRVSAVWFALLATIAVAALLFDFRLRIAIALCTALLIGLSVRFNLMSKVPDIKLLSWLGKISYSTFLIHFPVCMLVNTFVFRFAPNSSRINLAGMALAWILSVCAGWVFYNLVEARTWSLAAKLPSSTSALGQTRTA